MFRAAAFVLAVFAVACTGPQSRSSFPVPTGASTTVTATPPPSSSQQPAAQPEIVVRQIALDERVEDKIGDGRNLRPASRGFSVAVPRRGQLTATLTYDPSYTGTILRLTIDGVAFSTQPPWSPVIAQLPVEARKESLIVVSVYGSDWVPDDKFTLTTKLD